MLIFYGNKNTYLYFMGHKCYNISNFVKYKKIKRNEVVKCY